MGTNRSAISILRSDYGSSERLGSLNKLPVVITRIIAPAVPHSSQLRECRPKLQPALDDVAPGCACENGVLVNLTDENRSRIAADSQFPISGHIGRTRGLNSRSARLSDTRDRDNVRNSGGRGLNLLTSAVCLFVEDRRTVCQLCGPRTRRNSAAPDPDNPLTRM
jgi:hypothetical protein